MHSFAYRFNTVLTLSGFLLAILCTLASLSDNLNAPSSVNAHIQVLKINRFRKQLNGNDEVFVFIAAEYQTDKNSLNQISLWDHIILEKEQAKLVRQAVTKYPLIDQGSNLRGKQIKLVIHWYIMPRVGRMIEENIVMSEFHLPEAYT
ncbi:hypothetical protein IFM89_020483 [Coptis chinensis]|uniref:Signal peptidase complex subunit 3 n=1 Tax=Coptis chinensis TaxID=261450 RepID=A0A835H7L1_9MAGN|nr:hypothetical protein IFM89_020483 [Coptis chinensis]